MAGRWSAVVAARAIWPEHLIDQTFGSDVLNLRQNRGLLLFSVEPLANGVVDKSHETGRDDYAVKNVSDKSDEWLLNNDLYLLRHVLLAGHDLLVSNVHGAGYDPPALGLLFTRFRA